MAMNKTEKAYVEQLKRDLALSRSLRWTEVVKPDLEPSPYYDQLVKGYWYNLPSYRVTTACSSLVSHSKYSDKATTSQGKCAVFSTRLLALKAMRNEAEMKAAEELASIDDLIRKEEEATNYEKKET